VPTRIGTVSTSTVKDQPAITGVGYTKITRNSGVSVMALALQACANAIRDAGLTSKDIDGLVSYSLGDSIYVREVAAALGVPQTQWLADFYGGGPESCSVIAAAAMAISSGVCKHVLCYRAMNGRSGVRMGRRAGSGGEAGSVTGPNQFMTPFGLGGPPFRNAMIAQRHMAEYGTKAEHLGAIAITLRGNATKNPRALMRAPLTMDEYLASRFIAAPLRLLDCCQESDGGCAIVVSRSDLARGLPHRAAYVAAFASGSGPGPSLAKDKDPDFTRMFPKYIAPGLFHRAGVAVEDVRVAELYDAFTISVLCQLEDFGFCKKGEGGPFAAAGNISLDARVSVATHGGLLSEGHIHGMNNIAEAVSQIRGDAGPRQAKHADVVLCSGYGGGNVGCALLLQR